MSAMVFTAAGALVSLWLPSVYLAQVALVADVKDTDPVELVGMLNDLFSRYDEIARDRKSVV